MKNTQLLTAAAILVAGVIPAAATAQTTTFTENFTGTTTQNQWYYLNGACLTMGTVPTSTSVGTPGAYFMPGCVNLPYYNSSPLPEFGGDTGTLPDTTAGALRFTDWFSQTGAILSAFTFPLTGTGAQGLQVSFTSVTYEGDSGGGGSDGADGMSFFLQDATYGPDVGAFGGSLAYTCSNVNNNGTLRANGRPIGYDGLIGGFIGLGIDEFGNFLNQGDNTASGYGYVPGRIGLRGPGSTTWTWLSTNYPLQYPSTLTNAQTAAAVQASCSTGYVWDYSNPAAPVKTNIKLTDYAAIPGAYSVLPSTRKIANESATTRSQAIPIVYNLSVVPSTNSAGTSISLLSLSYSYNGGALQNVITNQDITANGTIPVPANVRFGFAGSTGGSRNIHEIMCFQATPTNLSQSSAGINQRQTAKVETGTQAYFALYNPTTLAGSVTSQYIGTDSNGNLVIDSTINWDGSCVLTGLTSGQICDFTGPVGPVAAQGSSSRVILTWNGSKGIPFEWTNLSAAQQSALDSGDAAAAAATPPDAPPYNYSRLNYLRGDRSNEQTPSSSTTYIGTFRARTSVLGDIIDSSPTWVGPPEATYGNTWVDLLQGSNDPNPENSGETYGTYSSVTSPGYFTRTNVVYVGANDGLLHGFRSGNFTAPGTYDATHNDGREVLAYMPGLITYDIQTATVPSTGGLAVYNSPLNYSDPQYGHRFDVDASPGTGDLFYAGAWHTWLVGGLGPGGNAIYALDVTDPSTFSEANAASLVIGEWSTSTATTTTTTGGVTTTTTSVSSTSLSCANDTTTPCGNHLGKTYGIPQIKRFHNGSWGAIFGNGGSSVGGDAGIYVMLVNPTTGPTTGGGGITFYYLSTSTGSTTTPNGIYYVSAADFDGDNIVDYVYAGDLLGHVWRFDLTSASPSKWGVGNANGVSVNSGGGTATPLFTTSSTQPITSQVLVVGIANTQGNGNPRILVEFGTGKQTPMTNGSAATFLTSQQALYGVWDYKFNTWNGLSTQQFDSLPTASTAAPSTALSGTSYLQQQSILGTYAATITNTGSDYRTLTSYPVCWADLTGCTQFGWYLNLVSGNAYAPDPAVPQNGNAAYANTPVVYEQVIYNPVLSLGAFVVNTTIPAANDSTKCFSASTSGWTMAIDPTTGGAFTTGSSFLNPQTNAGIFVNVTTTSAGGSTTTSSYGISGEAQGGTGSPSTVCTPNANCDLVDPDSQGHGHVTPIPKHGLKGSRVTWTQKR
jgi:type IV pilus assembly protein PilY1